MTWLICMCHLAVHNNGLDLELESTCGEEGIDSEGRNNTKASGTFLGHMSQLSCYKTTVLRHRCIGEAGWQGSNSNSSW